MSDWQAALVAASLAHNVKLWSDAKAAETYLADLIQQRLELASPEVCQKRQAFFGLAKAEDYAEQVLALDGATLLAGIRFRNLDPGFPFVELMTDLPPAELSARRPEIQTRLCQAYAPFAPLGMTLRLPAELDLPRAEVWNLYLAGPPRPASAIESVIESASLSLRLRRPARIMDQQRLVAAYQIWSGQHPQLAGLLGPESNADLQSALEAGLYFECDAAAECIGLIAGHAAPYWDQQGVCVIEELIWPHCQGRGYGRIMQRLFQDAIAPNYDCLWGTIHPLNQASLKTALRCGRSISEQEIFLRF
ncbi:MAG: hypothetical protein CVV27_18440 [Candidatus Melainabacteria bacterium HGW-Melainabacteria-1]|nr:MAG: hypothetical protein CVV27_18440 [Candidatus Melainabacteria bacterium HGW-Melainabacteria-1]